MEAKEFKFTTHITPRQSEEQLPYRTMILSNEEYMEKNRQFLKEHLRC